MKKGDIVISKLNDEKVEAVVDIVRKDFIYITPRGKLSLKHPERILVKKENLLLKQNNIYEISTQKIQQDAKDLLNIVMDINNPPNKDNIKPGTELTIRGTIYKIISIEEEGYILSTRDSYYRMSPEEINEHIWNVDDIIYKLYKLKPDEVKII